jgi:catechol-2,3-dioxygenase
VPSIHDLVEMRAHLMQMGALVGESDHGVSKSLYGKDVDGNEFEVMWAVPREHWTDDGPAVRPLDLPAEVARFG